MRLRHAVVIASVSLLFWPSITRGAITGWTDVTVRLYDASDVLGGTNQAALDLAGKTLAAASIDVIWRLCPNTRQAGPNAARCDAPLAPNELAIRIVRSRVPEGYHGRLPLGDALIDASHSAGVLATIYFDRVMWLANQSQVDSRALLGRAIAHELGHLLLATSAHGPVGLMRAFWSQAEVRRGQGPDWAFAPAELSAMSARASRLALQQMWGTRSRSRSGLQPDTTYSYEEPLPRRRSSPRMIASAISFFDLRR